MSVPSRIIIIIIIIKLIFGFWILYENSKKFGIKKIMKKNNFENRFFLLKKKYWGVKIFISIELFDRISINSSFWSARNVKLCKKKTTQENKRRDLTQRY